MKFILPAVIAVCAAVYLVAAIEIVVPPFGGPVNAKVFPIILGVAMLGAAVLLYFESNTAKSPAAVTAATPAIADTEIIKKKPLLSPMIIGIVIWTALYAFVFETLGYVIATSIYLSGLTVYFYRRSVVVALCSSVGYSLAVYVVISKLLQVKLPAGLLF